MQTSRRAGASWTSWPTILRARTQYVSCSHSIHADAEGLVSQLLMLSLTSLLVPQPHQLLHLGAHALVVVPLGSDCKQPIDITCGPLQPYSGGLTFLHLCSSHGCWTSPASPRTGGCVAQKLCHCTANADRSHVCTWLQVCLKWLCVYQTDAREVQYLQYIAQLWITS